MIKSPARFCADEAIKYLINKYCRKSNAAILDVGCGKGHYYRHFTSHAIKGSYLGIDVKKHETWQAKEEHGIRISFLEHDAEKLQNLNQQFNFIISIQSLEHMENETQVIKGLRICLKKGGYIMLTIPSEYSFFLYSFHGYRRYSIPKIRRLAIKNGLYVVEAIKLGGLTSSLLHFVLWTIPTILLRVSIWEFCRKSKFLINLIARLERFSLNIDKTFCLLESGYAVIFKRERNCN